MLKFLSGFRIPVLQLSLGFLGLSTIVLLCGWFWPWGWAIGIVAFFFCFKSDSEKKGYHF